MEPEEEKQGLTYPDVPVENVAEIVWGLLLLIYLVGAGRQEFLRLPVITVFSVSGIAALVEIFLRRARWKHLLTYDIIIWTTMLSAMVAVTGGRASEVWPAYILMSLTAPSVERRSIPYGLISINCLLYAAVYTVINPLGIAFNLPLLILRIGMVFLVAYVVDRSMSRERAAQRAAVEVAQNRVSELVSARDAERRRVAGDIHDWLGTGIIAPMRRLELALRAPTPEAAEARINESLEMLRRSHEELRRVMENLHPHLLEQMGLAEALGAYVRQWGAETGVAAEFYQEAGPQPSADVALACYRILQEALNNVAKHAHATRVEVRLTLIPEGLTLTVSDNGRGFTGQPRPGGRGLTGMSERASVFGGSVSIQSRPGQGTTVTAHLPARLSSPGNGSARA